MFDTEFFINFAIVFLLLFVSGFFAGIESSFFSMDWLKIKRLAKEGNKSAKIADLLRSRPKELVITFLIGNELVNITASAITTATIIKYFGEEYVFIAVIIMTVLILTFGEITPKTYAGYFPEKYALFASRPFYTFYIIATPFRFILIKIAEYVLKKLGLELPVESYKISGEDVRTIVSIGTEKNIFTGEEKEIIESALELHEVSVSEVMTPRRDIVALEKNITVSQALEKLEGKEFSRVPVYKDNLDNIVGILYLKDIIFLKFEGKDEPISKYLKKPFFVPEFTPLLNVMRDFKKSKSHMAIVINEHGTVVGLVTFQDILDFLVGDLPEDKDTEENDIVQLSKSKWRISGKAEIEEVAESLDIKLPEDYDFDTMGGFVLSLMKKIPKENEEIIYENFKFVIEKVENNRIVSVLAIKLTEVSE